MVFDCYLQIVLFRFSFFLILFFTCHIFDHTHRVSHLIIIILYTQSLTIAMHHFVCFLIGISLLPTSQSFLMPTTFFQSSLCCHFSTASNANNNNNDNNDNVMKKSLIHHTAMKTRNIETCLEFYSLLGFRVDTKFRAGSERAAWLSCCGTSGGGGGVRLEVVEIPGHILKEPEGMKRRALDLLQSPELLGWNHMALDVTESLQEQQLTKLQDWLEILNQQSIQTFGKTLRIAVPPRQQIIGTSVYELAFLYDADGGLVEVLHKQGELEQSLGDGWAPWDVELNLELDM